MSTGWKVFIGIFITFVVVIGGITGFVVSAKLTPERYEQRIFAEDESMQSTWGMMENELKMAGFTTKQFPKDFINTVKAQAARYENDKGSMMKWVQEAAGSLSPEVHTKFMSTIEKVYAKKEAKQLSKISVVQEYRSYLKGSVKGMLSEGFFNYPTQKASTIMDRIITTKGARNTWETGVEQDANNPFE